ncbi:hypothetical protein NEIMUCOT_05462 [Neisseria mucosa ATCC 25996]|uniref:Uncharacterized protein n=1 Tax=Neisseria mucosa (strain ATCC 25996 / DSM 4631 / NCTC 10774 / M26) TaxID=546266 RepID=D2ZXV8_NEIM2|nr:hypothetical protein NEIMUCOT_05462 [Neisseria mucosa ATCC 25996]
MPRLAVLSAASLPCPDLNLIHYTHIGIASCLRGAGYGKNDGDWGFSLN